MEKKKINNKRIINTVLIILLVAVIVAILSVFLVNARIPDLSMAINVIASNRKSSTWFILSPTLKTFYPKRIFQPSLTNTIQTWTRIQPQDYLR